MRLARLGGFALALTGLLACDGASDVDTDDPFVAPDIAGTYNLIVEGTNGCDNNTAVFYDWANGSLVITGAADSLTWDFLDGVSLSGDVDDTYGFEFGGVVEQAPWSIEAYGSGTVHSDADRWVLEGVYEVTADDNGIESDDCTQLGVFTATQLSGGE